MDDKNRLAVESFEREWTREFHGVLYQITMMVNSSAADQNTLSPVSSTLKIEVEQVDNENNDRWTGEFTSNYVEEITHKAGNFKKFSVFTRMLGGALTEENDSVLFVDLLTYSDLELLKARKSGHSNVGYSSVGGKSGTSTQAAISNKRYVILTYSGEFDRVHYPLPLTFENPLTPNIASWKRTVNRLRKQMKMGPETTRLNGTNNDDVSDEKEKERDTAKQLVSQLRQENTELRHRLRQMESRANNAVNNGHSIAGKIVVGNSGSGNPDLILDNTRLKKQIAQLKKELQDSSITFEKMRVEHLKEMNKLKVKFKHIGGVDGQDVGDSLDIYLQTSTRLESDATERGREKGREDALQKRIAQLEKDLAVSRGKSGRGATRSTTPTASRSTGRESDRERGREKERERERMKGRRESDRESEREREKGYSSTGSVGSRGNRSVPGQGEGRGERGGYSSSRSVSSTGRKRPSYNTGSLHSPTSASSARDRAGDRDRDRGHGGYMRALDRTPESLLRPPLGPSTDRPGTSSGISSRGGRFDPTAYQRRKDDIAREKYERKYRSLNRGRNMSDIPPHSGYGSDTSKNSLSRNSENTTGWNAGSGVRSGSGKYARSTYKDSGYSSAGSQSSADSRRSNRSANTLNSQNSKNSRNSKNSQRNRNHDNTSNYSSTKNKEKSRHKTDHSVGTNNLNGQEDELEKERRISKKKKSKDAYSSSLFFSRENEQLSKWEKNDENKPYFDDNYTNFEGYRIARRNVEGVSTVGNIPKSYVPGGTHSVSVFGDVETENRSVTLRVSREDKLKFSNSSNNDNYNNYETNTNGSDDVKKSLESMNNKNTNQNMNYNNVNKISTTSIKNDVVDVPYKNSSFNLVRTSQDLVQPQSPTFSPRKAKPQNSPEPDFKNRRVMNSLLNKRSNDNYNNNGDSNVGHDENDENVKNIISSSQPEKMKNSFEMYARSSIDRTYADSAESSSGVGHVRTSAGKQFSLGNSTEMVGIPVLKKTNNQNPFNDVRNINDENYEIVKRSYGNIQDINRRKNQLTGQSPATSTTTLDAYRTTLDNNNNNTNNKNEMNNEVDNIAVKNSSTFSNSVVTSSHRNPSTTSKTTSFSDVPVMPPKELKNSGNEKGLLSATTVVKNKSADPGSTSGIGMGVMSGEESDISEIDRRILALQDYLENARVGILRESVGGSSTNSPFS